MSTSLKVNTESEFPASNQSITTTRNRRFRKRRRKSKTQAPFIPHMTIDEASKLSVNDTIDHRDEYGLFLPAMIMEKDDTNLKIKYNEKHNGISIWCDYEKELDRFATYKSITKRPRHRLKSVEKGDKIRINPLRKKKNTGWKIGNIHKYYNKKYGQVQVSYKAKNGIRYLYWTHFDNMTEIKLLQDKEGIDHEEDIKKPMDIDKASKTVIDLTLIDSDNKNTKKSIRSKDAPFIPHLNKNEIDKLCINDHIDYRQDNGKWIKMKIINLIKTPKKNYYKVILAHDENDENKAPQIIDGKIDDILHRIARYGSITDRKGHRLLNIQPGEYVDVQPYLQYPVKHKWHWGVIREIDNGQVMICWEIYGRNNLYWTHLDNDKELAPRYTHKKRENKRERNKLMIPPIIGDDVINDAIKEPQRKRRKMEEEMIRIKTENEKLNKSIVHYQKEYGLLNDNYDKLRKENDLYKHHYNMIFNKYKEEKESNERINSKLAINEYVIGQQKKEIIEIRGHFSNKYRELLAHKNQNNALKVSIKKMENEKNIIKQRIMIYKNEHKEMMNDPLFLSNLNNAKMEKMNNLDLSTLQYKVKEKLSLIENKQRERKLAAKIICVKCFNQSMNGMYSANCHKHVICIDCFNKTRSLSCDQCINRFK